MYSKSYCAALQGTEGCVIQTEADISEGLPNFSLVGYLSSEVREARERVRIAVKNTGFRLPPKRVTVNLSPADIRKDGTGFDLAIAIAILAACGYVPQESLSHILWIGELNLEGGIMPVKGVLPAVYAALEQRMQYCVLPRDNCHEAQIAEGIGIIGVQTLQEAVGLLRENTLQSAVMKGKMQYAPASRTSLPDFAEVRGQASLRRAVEVAVSGMHNLLMIGPPGSGKTMVAKCVPGILPELTFDEQLRISKLYSISGLLNKDLPFITERPFRAPHHTITQTALAGGGRIPQPGEISLASGGVLFLDELPEFQPQSLEVLRQPLEDGWVTVSRLQGSCRYPADCLLMAAMNPCKCGYYPDTKKCRCSPSQIKKYLGRISMPLLDRFDVCAETVPLEYRELEGKQTERGESSEEIRKRIQQAHDMQRERYRNEYRYNAQLTPHGIREYCRLTAEAAEYLELIFEKMSFTARAYHKILKVGRSIADLDGADKIEKRHIAEAVFYRQADRKYWKGADALC